jgi:hypothetical protein
MPQAGIVRSIVTRAERPPEQLDSGFLVHLDQKANAIVLDVD